MKDKPEAHRLRDQIKHEAYYALLASHGDTGFTHTLKGASAELTKSLGTQFSEEQTGYLLNGLRKQIRWGLKHGQQAVEGITNPATKNTQLTDVLKELGAKWGILSAADIDPDASIAGDGSESQSIGPKYNRDRKPAKETHYHFTKNELVIEAHVQGGRCWICSRLFTDLFTRGKGKRAFERTVEVGHWPSKAAADDAGIILGKDANHAICHICNAIMKDAFGIDTPKEEMVAEVLRVIAERGINFVDATLVQWQKVEYMEAYVA